MVTTWRGSASPSGVLVSQTVQDLVVGASVSFEDTGEHELKGVLISARGALSGGHTGSWG